MRRATENWFRNQEWRFVAFNVKPESVNAIWTDREKAWYVKLELGVATPKDFPPRCPHISVAYGVQLPDKAAVNSLLMELRTLTPPMRLANCMQQRGQHNFTIEEESELWQFVKGLQSVILRRHQGDPVVDMITEPCLTWRRALVDTYTTPSSLRAPNAKGGSKGNRFKARQGGYVCAYARACAGSRIFLVCLRMRAYYNARADVIYHIRCVRHALHL